MGGRVRNLAILESLARSFELEIVTLVHDPARLADPGPVAGLGRLRPVLAWHRRGPLQRLAGQVSYRIRGGGWSREGWFLGSRSLARAVSESLRERPPAIVHVAYWYTLRHLRRRPRPPLWILDTHDVQFERLTRVYGHVAEPERRAEIAELSRSDLVIAITPRDEATIRSVIGPAARIETIGMGVDLTLWSRAAVGDPPRERTIVYYGNMATDSNRDAAIHLCTEIVPEIAGRGESATVVLIGADPAPEVLRLSGLPGVRITGTLPDPRLELARGGVFALCLRAASGIRSRACEAMALEVPVVAYPEALEGMDFAAGRDYLAAREPREFAAQIRRLLEEPDLAAGLTRCARATVGRRYSLEATYGRFPDLYLDLLEKRGGAFAPGERREGKAGEIE